MTGHSTGRFVAHARSNGSPRTVAATVTEVTSTAHVAGLRGRVRLEQEEPMGSFALGLLAAVATGLTLIVFMFLGHHPVIWPALPAGAGILAVLAGLRRKLRQAQAQAQAQAQVAV
jgi:hypothetical protein